MLAYQIRIALISLRRTPVLTALQVLAIALGIGVATAFVTTHHIMSGNPIPNKSERLHYVMVDSWDPNEPFLPPRPELPPNQLTYRDAVGLSASSIPTDHTIMFKARLTIHPEQAETRPYRALTRLCSSGFFPMFEVPFKYGGGWDKAADRGREPVVVIDANTNRKLFGGGDSVGRSIRIEDRHYSVVGVLDTWRPAPKYYDLNNDVFSEPEEIYIPFSFTPELEVSPAGNRQGWTLVEGDTYAAFLQSEDIWIQMWVELDSELQRQEYLAFLDAYATEQKLLGRFQRPLNNRMLTVTEMLVEAEVVPELATGMVVIALLFLFICSVNLIGILLGKLLARAPEVGVRRALGASRAAIFLQHLVECELIGLLGGGLGLGFAVLVLMLINRMLENGDLYHLDPSMIGAGLLLSLGAGLVAGIYPSWRICRVAPATYLKQQ